VNIHRHTQTRIYMRVNTHQHTHKHTHKHAYTCMYLCDYLFGCFVCVFLFFVFYKMPFAEGVTLSCTGRHTNTLSHTYTYIICLYTRIYFLFTCLSGQLITHAFLCSSICLRVCLCFLFSLFLSTLVNVAIGPETI
jgi:hypothetical protein